MARGPQHRLSDVDTAQRTARCALCGLVSIKRSGYQRNGAVWWRCTTAVRAFDPTRNARNSRNKTARERPYRKHVGTVCERCGFSWEDTRVFDVHHRNGDHDDNGPDNLETLCPTCHRLHHVSLLPPALSRPG